MPRILRLALLCTIAGSLLAVHVTRWYDRYHPPTPYTPQISVLTKAELNQLVVDIPTIQDCIDANWPNNWQCNAYGRAFTKVILERR